jgi:ATP-dependent Clp protease, protease subunit
MKNEIKLYGEIGTYDISGVRVSSQISEIQQKGYGNLTIRLHSPGGSVFEGNMIYNAIVHSPMKIKIIVDGIAASMAAILLLAADEVEICENAFVMVHKPQSNGIRDSDTLLQEVKLLKDIENQMAQCYKRKTGTDINTFFANWMDGKDHWLNAEEAVTYGFANRVIPAITSNVENLDKNKITSLGIKNIYNQFKASLNNTDDMKKLLIDTFQLQGVTEQSTDEEVLTKLREMIDKLKQGNKDTGEAVATLVGNARQSGLISEQMEDTYKNIGMTSGIAVLSNVLGSLKPQQPVINIASLIKDARTTPNAKKNNISDWTLDDYRKYAPNELRDNPKLYEELYKKEYGSKTD